MHKDSVELIKKVVESSPYDFKIYVESKETGGFWSILIQTEQSSAHFAALVDVIKGICISRGEFPDVTYDGNSIKAN